MGRSIYSRAIAVGAFSFGALIVATNGCGSDASPFDEDQGEAGSSGTSGTSGTSGFMGDGSSGSSGTSGSSGSSGSNGTSGSSGITDGAIPDVQFTYDAPVRPTGDACAESSAIATLKPLDMYVMMDRSGSMNEPYVEANDPQNTKAQPGDCNVGQTLNPQSLWCSAINALSAYFKSSASTGNAAALQFFFDASFTTTPIGPGCFQAAYSVAHNPIGGGYRTLPTSLFDSSLNALKPRGATPTEGAFRGVINFTKNNQRAGRVTIGVVITDGDPSNIAGVCNGDLNYLRDLLQAHYIDTGIRTFLIGMNGATFASLETMATGGNAPLHGDTVGPVTDACGNGAGPCRHFNIGDGTNNRLATALNQIQGIAIACQYNMPVPPVGVVNPNDVNVEYLQNGVPPAKKLTRVMNVGACVPDGWFYDNNASPTVIQLCATQCTFIQADPGAKINVRLGCLGG